MIFSEKISEERIRAAQNHVFYQHNAADACGYITIAHKDGRTGRFTQQFYTPEDIGAHIADAMGEDVFISQNTFYRKSRRIETIKQLRSLYVDIDFYNLGFTMDQVVFWLEEDYFNRSIPEPNMIIYSGRGIVLIWLIDPVPYPALPLWQAVQNYLTKQLEPLGGDPKATDAARVFRLAGTISSKNGNEVTVEYRHRYRYELRDIQFEFLPELRPKKEQKKSRKKPKSEKLFNIFTLHSARLEDLNRLVTMRDGDVEGCREIILFLYRYWSCCFEQDEEAALQHTIEFNSLFRKPLPLNEVVRATQSAETAYQAKSDKEANELAMASGYPGAGYRLTNKKIIEMLQITSEEQMHLKTIIGKEEKNRRKREVYKKNAEKKKQQTMEDRRRRGVVEREVYRKQEKEKVEAKADIVRAAMVVAPTATVRELAVMTGIPKSTVHRIILSFQ